MKSSLIIFFVAVFLLGGCRKENPGTQLASVNVTNAILNGPSVKYGSNPALVSNNNFAQFKILAGASSLYLYASGDSTHPYVNQTLEMERGAMYSVFLGGSATAVESVVVRDTLPLRTDSSAGVRFVNLSPNSGSVNITLSTTTGINEVSNLGYKQITSFKTYPALAANGTYVFQVRKSSDNSIITTYSLATPRFAHVTLVFRGTVGGSPSPSVLRVNNDR